MQSLVKAFAQAKRLFMLSSAFMTVLIYAFFASPSVYASTIWTPVGGPGMLGAYAMANLNGTLYVGTGSGVEQLSKGAWSSIGPSNNVSYMTAMNGTLYVGDGSQGVYKYTGASWSPVGGPSNKLSSKTVQGLTSMNGVLYAGTFGGNVYGFQNGSWHVVGNTLSASITHL
ncbi:hypothetical protein [Alicyclobacillus sp. SO9]|uniref:hypothetical protein n=1 Tax=Alicyclobacillus sp. SO9 TaxID=2665646 RepID=UPI0018E8CF3A|nr:hypothetical protein [Alicyclobacillus sp. SO9]QQE79012.1 hypothetical protein GI364_00330 [Alicyclobacillus sp. SO9]